MWQFQVENKHLRCKLLIKMLLKLDGIFATFAVEPRMFSSVLLLLPDPLQTACKSLNPETKLRNAQTIIQ